MTSQWLEPTFLLTKEGPSVIFGCGNVTIDVRVRAGPRILCTSTLLDAAVRQVDVGRESFAFSDSVFPCPLDIMNQAPDAP